MRACSFGSTKLSRAPELPAMEQVGEGKVLTELKQVGRARVEFKKRQLWDWSVLGLSAEKQAKIRKVLGADLATEQVEDPNVLTELKQVGAATVEFKRIVEQPQQRNESESEEEEEEEEEEERGGPEHKLWAWSVLAISDEKQTQILRVLGGAERAEIRRRYEVARGSSLRYEGSSFRLLLKSPGPVRHGLTALEYKAQLRQLTHPAVSPLLALPAPTLVVPAKAKALPEAVVDGDFAGGSSSEDGVPPDGDFAGGPPSAASSGSSSSASGSEASQADLRAEQELAGGSSASEDSEEDAERQWPSHIDGTLLRIVPEDTVHRYAQRLHVQCPNADHLRCHVSRSVRLDVATFGESGALVFLGTWMAQAYSMPVGCHKNWKPMVGDMREYMRTQGS